MIYFYFLRIQKMIKKFPGTCGKKSVRQNNYSGPLVDAFVFSIFSYFLVFESLGAFFRCIFLICVDALNLNGKIQFVLGSHREIFSFFISKHFLTRNPIGNAPWENSPSHAEHTPRYTHTLEIPRICISR